MPLIELQDISKLYGFGDATTVALEEISLKIEKGEFVAVMGPSGSGKSTLMHIIGLLDRSTHGKYKLNDKMVSRLRAKRLAKIRRDQVGFVFQFANLLPRLNVIDNVALPLAYKGLSKGRRLARASAVLERVGLSEREYFLPRQLSGGQIQRAAIARALINDPQIIIADEPTGNLDSNSSRVIMELLSEIHGQGATILMVTHNPELTRYASRVVYMHDGSIIHDEKNKFGEVAPRAKRTMIFLPGTTEDDDLAGVSAMMNEIPNKALAGKRRTRKELKSTKLRRQRRRKAQK